MCLYRALRGYSYGARGFQTTNGRHLHTETADDLGHFLLLFLLLCLFLFLFFFISFPGPSVRIKSQCGRRAYVKNVLYENITAHNVPNAVWIDMQYFSTATACPYDQVSQFENITVRNLVATKVAAAYEIVGLQAIGGPPNTSTPIHGITLENVHVLDGAPPGECVYAQVVTRNITPPLHRGVGCGGGPPAPPPPVCKPAKTLGCFDDTHAGSYGLLPHAQTQLHDLVTLENCAGACAVIKQPVAGVDGGNHCSCGAAADVAKLSGLAKPISECQTSPCHANANEKQCGGAGRMIAYTFACP